MIALREEEVMKSRGYASTVGVAYSAFTSNFRELLRFMWPYSLAYAIGIWLSSFIYMKLWPTIIGWLAEGRWLMAFGPWLLVLGLTVLFVLLLYGRTAMLLNNKGLAWNMARLLTLMLCLLPVFILSLVTLGLLWIPVAYPAYQYVVNTKARFMSTFFKGYATGLRHWGYMFLTQLLASICAVLVMITISMPMIVLSLAQRVSTVGFLEGDPLGVPSYFGFLVGGVMIATAFVASFVTVFLIIVGYYMYGSVATRERERRMSYAQLEDDK